MRRITASGIAAALVLIAASSGYAQIGIAAGGVYSNASVQVDGSDVPTDYIVGFSGGISYATGGMLGVIFGAYYTQRGFGVSGSNSEVQPAYIEVPVMAVVKLPIIEKLLGPRLYGGADLNYEVSCSSSGSLIDLGGFSCDETNKFDFALKGGLGLQVLFLGLDLSYTYGLTNIASPDAVSVKNRTLALALLFGIG